MNHDLVVKMLSGHSSLFVVCTESNLLLRIPNSDFLLQGMDGRDFLCSWQDPIIDCLSGFRQ